MQGSIRPPRNGLVEKREIRLKGYIHNGRVQVDQQESGDSVTEIHLHPGISEDQ